MVAAKTLEGVEKDGGIAAGAQSRGQFRKRCGLQILQTGQI
jgi:hypothetical protein